MVSGEARDIRNRSINSIASLSSKMALCLAVLDLVQREFYRPPPVWRNQYRISYQDLSYLEQECARVSPFDPDHHRANMLRAYKQGKAPFEIRTCPYGKVVVIYDNDRQDVPWALWGRILRSYAEREPHKVPTIYLLASPILRVFPLGSRAIGPANINGGYTMHGSASRGEPIMIYRAEDATRVLIHELQHACALDHLELGVDRVEAETEAWAELLYVGFLSCGDRALFHALLGVQGEWMRAQNQRVKRIIKNTMAFPWRYTVGKEEVWLRWGLLSLDKKVMVASVRPATHSLRLTAPPSASIQALHHVMPNSTIL